MADRRDTTKNLGIDPLDTDSGENVTTVEPTAKVALGPEEYMSGNDPGDPGGNSEEESFEAPYYGPPRLVPSYAAINVPMDEPEVNLNYRRAYHVRAEIKATFTPDDIKPIDYAFVENLTQDFKGEVFLYDWNGQEIFNGYNGVRISRAEYTALDVEEWFIPDSIGEPLGGEVEGEVDG